MASSVIEDSKKHFILDDEVLDTSKESCEDGSGMRFAPENAFYMDSSRVPYRYYRVALPSGDMPSVSVTNNKLVALGTSYCKSTPVKSQTVSVSKPYLKDNLWMADVLVPLTPVVKDHIKKGGIYITSGIIEGKEVIVKEAMEKAGFRVLNINSQGEWRSVTAVKE